MARKLVNLTYQEGEAMRPSVVFRRLKKEYPLDRAERIIAFMGNGVSLYSAIRATEPLTTNSDSKLA
jgi:hypothetical protein